MIRSFRHKGLQQLYESGKSAKVRPDHAKRCVIILDALDKAPRAAAMALPGLRFNPLKGHGPQRYVVDVSGPWRITFEWAGADAVKVDYEQFH